MRAQLVELLNQSFYEAAAATSAWRFRKTARIEIVLGVMPGIRIACPKEAGRTFSNFCRASIRNVEIAENEKSGGIC
jgi:hypothetical protein